MTKNNTKAFDAHTMDSRASNVFVLRLLCVFFSLSNWMKEAAAAVFLGSFVG